MSQGGWAKRSKVMGVHFLAGDTCPGISVGIRRPWEVIVQGAGKQRLVGRGKGHEVRPGFKVTRVQM